MPYTRTPFSRQTEALRRLARPDLKERQDESGHGIRRTYVYWYCRCPLCTRANMREIKKQRMSRKDYK
jgi:hypothetical protein